MKEIIMLNRNKDHNLKFSKVHLGRKEVNCNLATMGGKLGKRQKVASREDIHLYVSGDMQFWSVQLQQQVQSTEEQDRNDDGKIADEGTELEHIEEKGGQ